ncbi:hypothetical protein RHMOL_Rhmol09G0171700 [Rhododendron molle]|uniref:Uncharacterized protein n=1 Tax=Rhododendron molle TaxID=49168 RepID=A0ACC0MG72_RHOML|nr:hypothetical protein RHMOL_Rhmol09G0171700 [Rhododendron molle]
MHMESTSLLSGGSSGLQKLHNFESWSSTGWGNGSFMFCWECTRWGSLCHSFEASLGVYIFKKKKAKFDIKVHSVEDFKGYLDGMKKVTV